MEYSNLANEEIAIKLVGTYEANFEKMFVPRYFFKIEHATTHEAIGEFILRVGLTKELLVRGGHIGYYDNERYRGNYYASKAIQLLKPFMYKVHGKRILITCDESNMASRKTIEHAGGKLLGIKPEIEMPHSLPSCCYYLLSIDTVE